MQRQIPKNTTKSRKMMSKKKFAVHQFKVGNIVTQDKRQQQQKKKKMLTNRNKEWTFFHVISKVSVKLKILLWNKNSMRDDGTLIICMKVCSFGDMKSTTVIAIHVSSEKNGVTVDSWTTISKSLTSTWMHRSYGNDIVAKLLGCTVC